MSDPVSSQTPWLTVEINHRFGSQPSGFAMQLAFSLTRYRTVIFGPSGSGKSSLLRAIAGLLTPDAGHIIVRGETVWQHLPDAPDKTVPPENRRIGFVMQNPGLFPHLTVFDNVAFPLRAHEPMSRRETVFQLLQQVEAEPLAHRWPHQLSGGQQQRVALARTLAAQPRVLLLDEPFAALDAAGRQRLSARVHTWAAEHSVPVLTVTHNLEEAYSAGEEVLWMREGHIVVQGSPHGVLAAERHRLLTAFGVTTAT